MKRASVLIEHKNRRLCNSSLCGTRCWATTGVSDDSYRDSVPIRFKWVQMLLWCILASLKMLSRTKWNITQIPFLINFQPYLQAGLCPMHSKPDSAEKSTLDLIWSCQQVVFPAVFLCPVTKYGEQIPLRVNHTKSGFCAQFSTQKSPPAPPWLVSLSVKVSCPYSEGFFNQEFTSMYIFLCWLCSSSPRLIASALSLNSTLPSVASL